jgi:cell division protein FtsQ
MWNKPQLLNAIADLLMLAARRRCWPRPRSGWCACRRCRCAGGVCRGTGAYAARRNRAGLPGRAEGQFLQPQSGSGARWRWKSCPGCARSRCGASGRHAGNKGRGAQAGSALGRGARRTGQQLRRGVRAPCCRRRRQAALPLLYGPQGTAREVLKRYGEFVRSFQGVGEPAAGAGHAVAAAGLATEAGQRNAGRHRARAAEVAGRRAVAAVYRGLSGAVGKRATRPAVVDLRYPNGFAIRVAGEVKGK